MQWVQADANPWLPRELLADAMPPERLANAGPQVS